MRTFRWTSLKPWNGNGSVFVLYKGALPCQSCYLTQGVLPHAGTSIRLMLCCSRTLTPFIWELCLMLLGSWDWIAPSTQPFLSTKWAKCLCMISIRYGEACAHIAPSCHGIGQLNNHDHTFIYFLSMTHIPEGILTPLGFPPWCVNVTEAPGFQKWQKEPPNIFFLQLSCF